MSTKGKLLLFPTLLGENHFSEVLPQKTIEHIRATKFFIVENERTARRFISSLKSNFPIPELKLWLLNKHDEQGDFSEAFSVLENGENVGLLSEAGCPAIADPGNNIVATAHQKNIKVVPFVGPSSILLSLMASGFNGQNFQFHGYLPKDKSALHSKLKSIEIDSRKNKTSHLFIETPYRNNQMLEEIISACSPVTMLCIAADITTETEEIYTASLTHWKKNKRDFHKRPALFLLQA